MYDDEPMDVCPDCRGSGWEDTSDPNWCMVCDGEGQVPRDPSETEVAP